MLTRLKYRLYGVLMRIPVKVYLTLIIVILIANLIYFYQPHMVAELTCFKYRTPGEDGWQVNVTGSVKNDGLADGNCTLKLFIYDSQRHSDNYTVNVGYIPAGGHVIFDKAYNWRYDLVSATVAISYQII